MRNKTHPKWTHTTWPNRVHLGLHVCKLISSLFFVSLYSVCSWSPTIMPCLPVPVQLTWLQPQDSLCIRASHSHPVWSCLGPGHSLQPLLLPASSVVVALGYDPQPSWKQVALTLKCFSTFTFLSLSLTVLCPLCTKRLLWTLFSLVGC